MKKACEEALKIFNSTGSVRLAVVECIAQMENSYLINAGYGSSLTLDGTVECDASILNVKIGKWAAMSAISNVKNPIAAANLLYQKSFGQLSHGRIRPTFVCSFVRFCFFRYCFLLVSYYCYYYQNYH